MRISDWSSDVCSSDLGHEITFHQNGRAWLIADHDIAFAWDDFRLPVAATADSIDALETKLKMPPGALTQSVDYYNRYARDGHDPLLHKTEHFNAPLRAAPFTAYDLSVGTVFAPRSEEQTYALQSLM